jgi:N-methylhydantoinase A
VERGLDPEGFALLAYGGAGPMHACAVARNLGIPEVIIPVGPGAFSAMGLVASDIRHEFVRTARMQMTNEGVAQRLNDEFADVASDAHAALRDEGVEESRMELQPSLDMRYVGQLHTINVQLPDHRLDEQSIENAAREFHAVHEQTYSHAAPDEPVEIVNVRVAALGKVLKPNLSVLDPGDESPDPDAIVGEIETFFTSPADGWRSTPIFERQLLRAGNRFRGPAIVTEKTATIVIEPDYDVEVMPAGHFSIRPER